MKMIDISGQKFNFLTVIEKVGVKNNSIFWKCKCDCGNFCDVRSTSLRRKKRPTRSCGCYVGVVRRKLRWKGCGEISGYRWCLIKKCAKERNIPFEISIQDAWDLFLKQNRRCALSGDLLFFASGSSHVQQKHDTASLDRIDSLVGYTVNNIQWVHKNINRMKMSLSQNSFIEICKKIVNHRNFLDNSPPIF